MDNPQQQNEGIMKYIDFNAEPDISDMDEDMEEEKKI